MAYKQTDWKDHVTEYENRYRETENADGSVTHTKVEGEVIQQGTPMSATNFNHMEEGIGEAAEMADLLFTQVLLMLGHSEYSLDSLVEAIKSGDLAAAKAAALSVARTIALSGGATGTATAFDGSGNITIPVTALDPTKLSSAVPVAKGGTGAAEADVARANLGVPSKEDLWAAIIYENAKRSVDQAVQRDHEDRLITAEAQLAALTA